MQSISEYKNRLFKLLAPSLLIGLTLYIFGTLNIFIGNVTEFEFGYLNLLPIFLLFLIVTTLAILLMGMFLSGKNADKFVSIIFILGILLWIQGNFLNSEYGVFDGREINWEEKRIYGFDILIWLCLILLSIKFSSRLSKHTSIVSMILIALQLFVIGGNAVISKNAQWIKPYHSQGRPQEGISNYSSKQNIIHILFDGFQTDIFLELVKEGALENEFKGFIVFENNMAVVPLTSFAIPAIFSGDVYDGTVKPSEYYQTSVSKKGFQNVLYDNGFRVNLIPTISMRNGKFSEYYTAPTVYNRSVWQRILKDATYLLDASLFRNLPHYIKKYIFNNNNWMVSRLFALPPNIASFSQKAFLSDYIDNLKLGDSKPAYHFMHLMPPHPPYVTNKDGSYAGVVLPMTRENSKNEAKHILDLFLKLLKKLKKLGVYDPSLILLQADHGGDFPPVIKGKEVDLTAVRVPALLAIKPPHNRDEFLVSAAETTVADIPATIMDVLNLEHSFNGLSIFKIKPGEKRSRGYFIYDPNNSLLHKYTVKGSIYDPVSWSNQGTIPIVEMSNEFSWGTPIIFGITGNSDPYKAAGWSSPDSGHEWTNGNSASLVFAIEAPKKDVFCKAKFIPFIHPGKVDKQQINVIVNGQQISEWTTSLYKPYTFEVKIPKGMISSDRLTITFEMPDAVVPRSIGAGADRRKVGIAMLSIQLYQVQ